MTATSPGARMNDRHDGIGGGLRTTAVAVVLTAVMAAPVLIHPAARLFGNEIVGRHHDAYTVITQFERPVAFTFHTQPATDLVGAALARLAGGVAAYNIIVLASFPLAALFAWLLMHRLTRSAPAAMLAALGFAFSTFHVAQAAYHPHVAQVQWIPLYLLALWLCLDRFTLRRGMYLAGAAALVAMTNFYGGFIAAVLTPVAVAAFALVRPGDPGAGRAAVVPTLWTLGIIALAGAAYVLAMAPWILSDRQRVGFPSDDVMRYGAAWWAYLLPSVDHPVAGAWSARVFADAGIREGLLEQQLGLGVGLLGLAAVALGRWLRRREDGPATRAVPALLIIGLAAFICSLAPGQRVGPFELWTPSTALHAIAPMFRSYARFGVVVTLAVSGLAGIGFAYLAAAPRRLPRALGYALLALACVELAAFPPWRWHHVLPTDGHRLLATLPADVRILDMQRPTLAEGTLPALVRRDLTFLTPVIADITDPDLAPALAALGYTHAIYRRPSAASRWIEGGPSDGFRVLEEFEDSVVLAVEAPPPAVTTRWTSGFHPRERDAGGSWRWMGGTGTWSVTNHRHETLRFALDIQTEAFPYPREVDILLNGRLQTTLRVQVERRHHRIEGLTLRPGASTLMFRARTPPVVADTVLHNGDQRPLSLAVRDWTWTEEPQPSRVPTEDGAGPSRE